MALTGGGGTDMRQGIQAALADEPRPHVVVVLTDAVTPWPETAPDVPVIIGLLGNRRMAELPEWGTVIPIVASQP